LVGDAGDAPLAALPNIDRILLSPAALEGDLTTAIPRVRAPGEKADIPRLSRRAGVRKPTGQSPSEIRDDASPSATKARAARDEKLRAEVAEMRIRDRRVAARTASDAIRYAQSARAAPRAGPQKPFGGTLSRFGIAGPRRHLTDALAAHRAETRSANAEW